MSDPAYCLLGARAIQEKIAAIRQEIAGVRQAEDIECLHRMRVGNAPVEECAVDFFRNA